MWRFKQSGASAADVHKALQDAGLKPSDTNESYYSCDDHQIFVNKDKVNIKERATQESRYISFAAAITEIKEG